jgi:hypothetical protein
VFAHLQSFVLSLEIQRPLNLKIIGKMQEDAANRSMDEEMAQQRPRRRSRRDDDAHAQIIRAFLPASPEAHVIVLTSSLPAGRAFVAAPAELALGLGAPSPAPEAELADLPAFTAARVASRPALVADDGPYAPSSGGHLWIARGLEIARLHGVLIVGVLLATVVFVHTTIQTSIVSVPSGLPHVQPGIMVSWTAPPSPPLAPGAQPGSRAGALTGWQLATPSCALPDFVALMSCRHGYSDECCASYRPFLEHQCVCDWAAWPWKWIPPDSTSAGWMFNLLKCRYTLAEIANYSGCVDQVRPSAPPPPAPARAPVQLAI